MSRRLLGALAVSAAALTLAPSPPDAVAASLDACAQRVIRDWYSGGRIDDLYPLACYRAALRALPTDVLQYSDADRDIRRALAFARQQRPDPGDGGSDEPATAGQAAARAGDSTPGPASGAKTSAKQPHPVASEAAPRLREARLVPETSAAASSLPYPIVALAALSAVLLTAGATGWLAALRRRSDTSPDR